MQLSPGEHSILAYFPTSTAAQEAAEALKATGIADIQLDRVSRFGVNNDSQYNNPIAGRAETQTGLTLFSANTDHFNDNDSRILMAADPSVQGYTPPGYGRAGEKSFLVTVVTDEAKLDEATSILKDKGAYF